MDVRHLTERVGRVAVVVASAIPLLAYTWIAVRRMGSPMELEWMEGGVVDHVRRAADGRNLYPEPSLEFIPYIYTPLYYYVAAPVAAVFGDGFLPLRLVSFASSLVAFASVGVLVARERGDRVAGLVAAGVFAACFAIGGAWFDLARVDSLFLALTFAGLAVARHGAGVRSAVAAGVLLGLAFLTKQQALVPAAAPLLYLLVAQRRRAVAYAASVAIVVVVSTLVLQQLSDGWYLRYVLELPRGHEVIEEVRRTFWTVDLRPLVLSVALGAVGVAIAVAARRELTGPLVLFHLPVAAALVASSYASRLHSGGYDNVLLPAFGALAILAGLGWSELDRRPAPLLRVAAAVAVVAQLV
ncbi:MAG TPA: glycosyltransferase family 39 protein, partial [Aquihabitans sp.]|nr:glycosyltransferase family 39 protein [Aquihabitans sp.]